MKNCILFFKRVSAVYLSAFIFVIGIVTVSNAQPSLGTTSFTTGSTVTMVASTPCTAGQSGTSAGYLFTVFSGANCALNNVVSAGSDGHINLITSPTITGIWQEGRIASSNGSEFQLDNFVFSVLTVPFIGKTIIVTGYRNGSVVPGATAVSGVISATGVLNTVTVNVTANMFFDNIDEFRLTPSGVDAQGTVNIQSITISSPNITLPLTFLRMNAFSYGKGIKVEFGTADESNIDSYEIQFSNDGNHYQPQKTIPANNGSINNYEAFIPGYAAKIWVRVVSMEITGGKEMSNIVIVQGETGTDKIISVFPNPAKDVLYVDGADNPAYNIISLQGAVLQKGTMLNKQVDIRSLSPGIYLLKAGNQSVRFYKN
ncbi:MAG: T9SS type A sorting domain-containing protein [Lacibacter sp.]